MLDSAVQPFYFSPVNFIIIHRHAKKDHVSLPSFLGTKCFCLGPICSINFFSAQQLQRMNNVIKRLSCMYGLCSPFFMMSLTLSTTQSSEMTNLFVFGYCMKERGEKRSPRQQQSRRTFIYERQQKLQ